MAAAERADMACCRRLIACASASPRAPTTPSRSTRCWNGASIRTGSISSSSCSTFSSLNDGLVAGRFDAAKASFHAALLLADRFGVLRAGSALGYGVGPLLVSAEREGPPAAGDRILCPGETTTATLLFRLLHPDAAGDLRHRVFSDIGPALRRGDADFGVLIHEGRLTYERDGLRLVEDLGATFEQRTGAPVPLGGILADRRLGDDVHRRLTAAIRDSIAYGRAHPEETLPTIRRHAQELDEDVIWPYVDLYVTDATVDLGDDGERALAALSPAVESVEPLAILPG